MSWKRVLQLNRTLSLQELPLNSRKTYTQLPFNSIGSNFPPQYAQANPAAAYMRLSVCDLWGALPAPVTQGIYPPQNFHQTKKENAPKDELGCWYEIIAHGVRPRGTLQVIFVWVGLKKQYTAKHDKKEAQGVLKREREHP